MTGPKDIQSGSIAIIKNNLAWTILPSANSDRLVEADKLSADVIACEPNRPEFMSTRGTALIALGRFDEGIRLLDESIKLNANTAGKAYNACIISEAETARGNLEEAARYREMAKNIAPECILLERQSGLFDKLKEPAA